MSKFPTIPINTFFMILVALVALIGLIVGSVALSNIRNIRNIREGFSFNKMGLLEKVNKIQQEMGLELPEPGSTAEPKSLFDNVEQSLTNLEKQLGTVKPEILSDYGDISNFVLKQSEFTDYLSKAIYKNIDDLDLYGQDLNKLNNDIYGTE